MRMHTRGHSGHERTRRFLNPLFFSIIGFSDLGDLSYLGNRDIRSRSDSSLLTRPGRSSPVLERKLSLLPILLRGNRHDTTVLDWISIGMSAAIKREVEPGWRPASTSTPTSTSVPQTRLSNLQL